MKNKNIQNYIFFYMVMIAIVATSLFVFLHPQKLESSLENRTLSDTSDLVQTSFFKKDFQSTIDEVISDQFPLRNRFVSFKSNMDLLSTKIFDPFTDSLKLTAVGNTGVYKVGITDYLVDYPFTSFDDYQWDYIDRRISQINELALMYPNVNMYMYHPLMSSELTIFDDDNDIKSIYPEIEERISSNLDIPSKFMHIDSFEQYQDFYYSSDLHWNNRGSYEGYKEIVGLMNLDGDLLEPKEEVCNEEGRYYGAYTTRTGNIIEGAKFCVYTYDLPKYDVYDNNGLVDNYVSPNKYAENPNVTTDEFTPALAYLDYSPSGIFINESALNDKVLLVIGDSFTDWDADLIASHFKKTIFINPYEYLSYNNEQFFYDDWIENNGVTDILFTYTIRNWIINGPIADGEMLAYDINLRNKGGE